MPPVAAEYSWSGEELTITLQEKLRKDITYALTIGSSYTDLRGNKPKQPFSLIFATGDKLDSGMVSGTVFPSIASQKALAGAFAWLYRLDSATHDINPALDTADYSLEIGTDATFAFRALPLGDYRLFVVTDEYKKQLYDSTTSAFGTTAQPILIDSSQKRYSTQIRLSNKPDKRKPTLLRASAVNQTTLRIQMSEPVVVSSMEASSIFIQDSAEALPIFSPSSVYVLPNDSAVIYCALHESSSGFQHLVKDTRWRVTIPSSVVDTIGNRVEDSTRVIMFSGSSKQDTTSFLIRLFIYPFQRQ
jgi:hypothetical protein